MKARASKLDQYAEQLDGWELAGKTLEQMAGELHELGCDVSLSRLSDYLSSRREARLQEKLFASIATGGRMNKELDQAYERNPAPDIEQLMRLNKTLIMSLQVKGAAEPEYLKLANAMQQTWLNYLSGLKRAELEEKKLGLGERRVRLLEQKIENAAKLVAAARESKGGITDETMEKIERELKLL